MTSKKPIAQHRFDTPYLSICCVTYNHVAFIRTAIEGFLRQETDFPVEVLIHDDCSTDGTREIVQFFADRHPNLIRLSLPDQNQYSRGIAIMSNLRSKARGAFIALCEGDDYWSDPTKLQKQVDYLRGHPECVITGHDYIGIYADGRTLSSEDQRRLFGASSMPNRDLTALELKTGAIMSRTCTRVFRNIMMDTPPEKDKVLGGDMFLSSLFGQHGSYHHVQGLAPSAYRVHDGGVWNGLSIERRQKEALNTFYWMYVYYQRIGDSEVAGILARRQSNLKRRIMRDRMIRRLHPVLSPARALWRRLYNCLSQSE